MSAAPAGPPAARGGSIAVYVVMKVSVSWCTTAGLGVATSLLSAIQALVERSPVPATIIDVPRERFPAMIEATAYFVVSEALVNVAKHAKASTAQVSIRRLPGRLAVRVSDDGPGVDSFAGQLVQHERPGRIGANRGDKSHAKAKPRGGHRGDGG